MKPWSQGWLIAAGAYPGFCSMKRLEVFLLPLDGMLVHRRSLPRNFVRFPQQIAGTHLYSGVERTNHEATVPPKVKRNALINSFEKGGLKMPDIESMVKAQRVLCIKKFLETYPAGWKVFLEFYLKRVGGKFLFHCNFDFKKLPIALPDFYKECISTWSSLSEDNSSSSKPETNHVMLSYSPFLKTYTVPVTYFLSPPQSVKNLTVSCTCFVRTPRHLQVHVYR